MSDPLDVQVGGTHYKSYKIQPVEFSHANKLDFIQGSIVKYIVRFREKNGADDLLKIKHYVDLLLKMEYGIETDSISEAAVKLKGKSCTDLKLRRK